MKMRCTGLLAFALTGVAAASANAADLAVKAPVYKAPPPMVVSDWSGFYIGINGGYGWGKTSLDPDAFDAIFGDAKPKGGLFGGHAGYNWQYGKVVTGLEVDFDGADIKGTDSVSGVVCPVGIRIAAVACQTASLSRTVKFDELATARARLGYALLPDLLAYGTAGIAWGHSSMTAALTFGKFSASEDANANNFGWAGGGGLEYYLGHGFIVRGEYLHYDFAKTAYGFTGGFSPNAATAIDVVRGGLSYKF
jgi:outer membrane immunogenic protein